jgi:hypothetical protein
MPAERREVVLAHQPLGGLVHPLEIQWPGPSQGDMSIQRIGAEPAVAHPIGVAPPQRGEASVEARGRHHHPHQAHVVRQGSVDASQIEGAAHPRRHVHMRHLTAGMHSRIRSPRARDVDSDPEQVPQDPLQLSLHGAQVRLLRPSGEVASVVGDVQAQTNQPVAR